MLTALVGDTRLSDLAVRLGLFIAMKGEGSHEIGRDAFRVAAFGSPGKDRVARALSELELHGYVDRQAGGSRHPDRFRFTGFSVPETRTLNPVSVRETRTVMAPIDRQTDDRQKEEPPYPPSDLSEDAGRLYDRHRERLNGSGEALRDYLIQRVPPECQTAYIRTVLGWLDGMDMNWRRDNGLPVPPGERTAMLGQALSLLGASNGEQGMKRTVGDPDNLRTKLVITMNRNGGNDGSRKRGNGNGSRRTPGEGAAAAREAGPADSRWNIE